MLQPNFLYRLSAGILVYILIIIPVLSQKEDLPSISIPDQELNNLIQGRKYYPVYPGIVGSQFITDQWKLGQINLMGQTYSDLPLWYDIYADNLILMDWDRAGYGMLKLNKEHIESFTFSDRLFVNPNYNTYAQYALDDKFYEVMTEGVISFLISRNLDVKEKRNTSRDHFIRKDSRILIHSDQMFEFKNKKSFLKAIPISIKDEVSEYIKKSIIRLKDAKDTVWTSLVKYANGLIKKQTEKE